MKVVALVSGGKDSCYAMMRCRDYGHEIVALANLMPLEDSVDELDSYMYQTVGHQIIVNYAECMGVPLFRRRIRGSSRHQNLNYLVTSGDEVEDMLLLLNEVKNRVPSVTAVSSGAIASDYQRLRVENVCSRLGLISLAYLWKQDQTSLLEEMIRREIKAIIVKVAAIGLKPSEHLGKDISEMQAHLLNLKEMYGINICGEGGEYETLTLDCPLFKNARIVLDDFKVVLHSEDSIASVGILHPFAFHLDYKDQSGSGEIFAVHEVEGDYVPESPASDSLAINRKDVYISRTKGTLFSMSSWVHNSSPAPEGLREDLFTILEKIELELIEEGLNWAHVLYIHLYISNMKEFSLANEVYLEFITEKKCHAGVPSRSTIELPLVKVNCGNAHVEVLVSRSQSKRVLHVQSISGWAPSCIGPYSQATLEREVLYMAGQLGLDPPTMMLRAGGPSIEMDQALENCEAVASCFNGSLSLSSILIVIYCSSRLTLLERKEVQMKVELFLKRGSSSSSGAPDPLFLYVLAPDLPKSALVEVKPVLHIPEERETEHQDRGQDAQSWDVEHSNMRDSCCQKWIMPGKICSVIISITEDLILHACSQLDETASSAHLSLPEKHLERASRLCFSLLHRTLSENHFFWGDLISLRFYFSTTLCTEARELELILSRALSELTETSSKTIFSVIPVLSSGGSAAMDDLLTCELFAAKV